MERNPIPIRLYLEACDGCKHLKRLEAQDEHGNDGKWTREFECTVVKQVVPLRYNYDGARRYDNDSPLSKCARKERQLTMERLGEL